MLVCLGVLSAVSACAIDVTEFTPFAKEQDEPRVARDGKANPINATAVADAENAKAGDRIATRPAYASASSGGFTESAKLRDRISGSRPETGRGSGVVPDSITVSHGDTLYSIARRYRVKLQELMALNNIDSPANLHIGQRLRMPRGQSTAQPVSVTYRRVVSDASSWQRPAKSAVITPAAGVGERRVTLTSGTTLYRIAHNNGITVAELARANGIDDPARVPAGLVLRIPESGTTFTPAARPAPALHSRSNAMAAEPVVTGAIPASERNPGVLARRRANRKAAAIAAYLRTASQYRVTPGQTILVPF